MLVLLFELGEERCAIDSSVVIEVRPLAGLRPWPGAPAGIAGVLNFRGTPIPVIDLAERAIGRPAERRLSTRLVVVTAPAAGESTRLVGLIAERATATARYDANDFAWLHIEGDPARSLGPVATDARGLLQLIDMRQLVRTFVRGVPATIPEAACPSPTSTN